MPPPPPSEPASCKDCWLRLSRNADSLAEDEHPDGEWKTQLALSLVCATSTGIATILHHRGLEPASLATFALAYLAGAWEPAHEVLEKIRNRQLDVHFLMLAVAAGAAAIGEWAEGAILLFLFSFAGALEHFALERTRRAINSLINTAPKTALRILPDGSEAETPVEQLHRGMLLRIPPGSQFPVDCSIASGETHVDESSLTGEAVPVPKKRGDQACSGTLNIEGSITASVLRPASQSALQRIISLIRDAQRQKAPSQRFTDRFGNGYTLSILLLTLGAFLTWWLLLDIPPFHSNDNAPSAFYRAMTLLVVASPCALVLSIPSAILAAIARGARHGILFRGGVAVEHLADTHVVAMDKTGTLTTGELKVENVIASPPKNTSKSSKPPSASNTTPTTPSPEPSPASAKPKASNPNPSNTFAPSPDKVSSPPSTANPSASVAPTSSPNPAKTCPMPKTKTRSASPKSGSKPPTPPAVSDSETKSASPQKTSSNPSAAAASSHSSSPATAPKPQNLSAKNSTSPTFTPASAPTKNSTPSPASNAKAATSP